MSWTITPSTKVPVDPFRSQVSLLLHGDGANGSTTIVDNSPTPKTVTAVGNAQISTAQSKFGGASIAFDGTTSGASIASNSSLALDTQDFTVELWVYPNNWSSAATLLIGNVNSPSLQIGIVSNKIGVALGYVAWRKQDVDLPALNTWTHVAIVRRLSILDVYLDGTKAGASVLSSDNFSAPITSIGRTVPGDNPATFFNGYIDDLRITKGVARYTSNFTPPTAPFPDI